LSHKADAQKGETKMKRASWRASSEEFFHMLAVTTMLVITSILFYWR